jgi:hypothetical protein
MSYTLGLAIILAEDDTGLTLRGQLVDNSGANVGSAFTTGFAERRWGPVNDPLCYASGL